MRLGIGTRRWVEAAALALGIGAVAVGLQTWGLLGSLGRALAGALAAVAWSRAVLDERSPPPGALGVLVLVALEAATAAAAWQLRALSLAQAVGVAGLAAFATAAGALDALGRTGRSAWWATAPALLGGAGAVTLYFADRLMAADAAMQLGGGLLLLAVPPTLLALRRAA